MKFLHFLLKFLPDYNKRKLKPYYLLVKKIVALEKEYQSLSDSELKHKTIEFKKRLKKDETLDDLLVEAFASVKEASRRVLGLVHFEEQLLAGIALHKGKIIEMKTGEGKTLSATLPSYLNALSGKSVHIATVNDYLAKRDSDDMGRVYKFLGLTCGCVLENFTDDERRLSYSYDVVYSTGAQFGFDYLGDNMKYEVGSLCFRGFDFIIVDEADKLIDDGRTPLVISSEAESSLEFYSWIYTLIERLKEEDYEINRKENNAVLTESGMEKIEKMLHKEGVLNKGETFYRNDNLGLVHGVYNCLKAFVLYKKDVDYIVKKNEVMIIDEMTGRILDGRRYSEGLHQALEAKERLPIQNESVTAASISYQKFFCLYKKISGMSGTCMSEAEEFEEIYKVDVVAIPTNKPMIREDLDDEIYRTFEEKFDAIIKEVEKAHKKEQPILVITGSVEASSIFSNGFSKHGFKHKILNAKQHKEEAEVIAQAGMPGAITIATNMAGRGTDIQLGGNIDMYVRKLREKGLSDAEIAARKPKILKEIAENKEKVLNSGGLFVIGTERNESRRVDDQARGRAGRQGDVGKSKFLISLDDALMQRFSNVQALKSMMGSRIGGVKKGEELKSPWLTRKIKKVQADVELHNFDSRKHLLKYDEVLNDQRNMVYEYRNKFLHSIEIKEQIESFVNFKLETLYESKEQNKLSQEKFDYLIKELFGISSEKSMQLLQKKIMNKLHSLYEEKKVKYIFLYILDQLWKEHLGHLDYLRQIVNLKSYAQKDPLVEYKTEAFILFEAFLENFRVNSIKKLFVDN